MALPKFRVDENATPAGAGLGYRYVICVEDENGEARPLIERRSNGQDQYLTYKQESIATRKLYEVQHHQQDGIPSAQVVDLAAEAEAKVKDRPGVADWHGNMPSPTEELRESPEFQAVWECIKSWDVNVPAYYEGYCGATGSHVTLILDALDEAGLRIVAR